MARFKNTAPHVIVIRGTHGLLRIGPGEELDLEYGVASRGFPYLKEVAMHPVEAAASDSVEQAPDISEQEAAQEVAPESVPEPEAESESESELAQGQKAHAPDVLDQGQALAELSVTKLKASIADIDDVLVLEAALEAEQAGRNRQSAIHAIEKRLAEVS